MKQIYLFLLSILVLNIICVQTSNAQAKSKNSGQHKDVMKQSKSQTKPKLRFINPPKRQLFYRDFSDKNRQPLDSLARSNDLWERRIAIIATFYFIKRDDFAETLHIVEILLNYKEDLIHKAVGWMLRETGKRSLEIKREFLRHHYQQMPRTILHYAIEKFPEIERRNYLKSEI